MGYLHDEAAPAQIYPIGTFPPNAWLLMPGWDKLGHWGRPAGNVHFPTHFYEVRIRA